jgi:predicted ATPase
MKPTVVSVRGIADLERGSRRFPYADTVRRLSHSLDLTPAQRDAFLAAGRRPPRTDHEEPGRVAQSPGLPVELTTFIGRDRLVRDIAARITSEAPMYRLLTLTGPGGTGKTRLSIQAARIAAQRFREGVAFVSLASIAVPFLVAPTIAQSIGVPDTRGLGLDVLVAYLRDRHMLLVLDNFEQVLAAASDVAVLLASCVDVKLVITSRAPLRILGEWEVAIPPLSLPDRAVADPEELRANESIRLFVERVRTIKGADFQLTADNLRLAAEICRQVDGLPLAIELATASTRVLDLQALLSRLDQRLTVLTGGTRDLPRRQQTIADTVAWSYDLLPPAEQALFRQLAAFVGGCTLEAIESVTPPHFASHTLDLVESLVANSLLRSQDSAQGVRFSMLETVREFGLAQLTEAGELTDTRERHARYFLELAEQAEALLATHGGLDWLDGLDLEHDNFRAALEHLLSCAHEVAIQQAQQLAGALTTFWWLRGYLDEGRRWLRRALDVESRSAARMKALHRAAFLAHIQRDQHTSWRLLDESLEMARELQDQRSIAWILQLLGRVCVQRRRCRPDSHVRRPEPRDRRGTGG